MLKITLSPKAIAPLLIVFMLFGIAGSLHAYYDWPLAPMYQQHHVFSTFDEFRSPSAACPVDHFHDGVDIHGYTGNEVLAVMGGTVQFMDEVNGLYINGSYVIGYAHVNHPDLANGQSVNYGDPIGTIDSENHLHFMEGPDKDEVNPLSVCGLFPRSLMTLFQRSWRSSSTMRILT